MTVATIMATGVANTASVRAAMTRCGVRVRISDDVAELEAAALLVLPGVGSFGAGVARLTSMGADRVIIERVRAGRPTLGVCLGMQLLCAASDEAPGVAGLGVVPHHVRRFGEDVRTPQFGWNRVQPEAGCDLIASGSAYFANTYRLVDAPAGWAVARSVHGGPFIAAMQRGCVLACQFHPELSGTYGQALLSGWIARSLEATPC